MTTYIVTIKLGKDPDHDPSNKKTGECIVSGKCSDVTGQHHSFVIHTEESLAALQLRLSRSNHVTRIEEA